MVIEQEIPHKPASTESNSNGLELLWLGDACVRAGGIDVPLETRKAVALLSYLSLSPAGRPRDVLATLFWPGYDGQHALGNLRRALTSLNSRLGKEWFHATNETILLNRTGRLGVDVEQFLACVTDCKRHDHTGTSTCDDCIRTLEEAAALYRGDFLQGLNLPDCTDFDEWQFLQREELRRELAWVLERLSRGYEEQGAWEQALAHARRWVALDRPDEKAQRTLMKLYASAGRRTAALRQYEECKRVLSSEVGQEPEEETTRLYEQIRSGATGPAEADSAVHVPAVLQEGKQTNNVQASFATRPPVTRATDRNRRPVQAPLLRTKLFVPQPRPELVQRTRLLARLDESVLHPLTLISAPAGFGKTSLLGAWASRVDIPVAWVSLDPQDNDLGRFLQYVVSALEGVREDIVAGANSLMGDSEHVHWGGGETALGHLLNNLHPLEGPFVLVLDDYQAITSVEIHKAVAFLLDHMPPCLHLIISTRSDPPLALSRLRARAQMVEIRANMLRFTNAEAASFLNEVMGLDLSDGDVGRLAERTEGWIAGLQMAALSMSSKSDLPAFVRSFSGSNHYILDYLLEEVLSGQTEDTQAFLMQTSILDRLCGPLCDAVTEQEGGQHTLEELERTNLFIVPLDEERQWFRYHHLFSDLLQARLKATGKEIVSELHLRASSWYALNSQYTEAVNHACEAGDYNRAAEILEGAGQAMWNSSEMSAFNWPGKLPRETMRLRPWLCVHRAWKCLITGNMAEAETWLREAECHIRPEHPQADRQDLFGFTSVMHALLADYHGDMSRTLLMAEQALKYLSNSKAGMRNIVLYVQAFAHYINGNFDEAAQCFQNSVENDREGTTTNTLAASMAKLAKLRMLEGRLREAAQILEESLAFLEERGIERFYTAGNLNVVLGELLYERNKLDDAEKQVREGIRRNSKWNISNSFCYQQTMLSRILKAKGDLQGAELDLEAALKLDRERNISQDARGDMEAWSLRLMLAKRDFAGAERWALEAGPDPGGPFVFRLEAEHMALARLYIAEGKPVEAVRLLDCLEQAAKEGGRTGRRIEALVLRAVALLGAGKADRATRTLGSSLTLAAPEGYIRTFIDEGAPVKALLKMGLATGEWSSGPLEAYARTLLEAFGGDTSDTGIQASVKIHASHEDLLLVEPLSDREFEVLSLLSQGLTYRDIARQLILATGTVKTHVHNVYGKLGAANKVEAIVRARELQIL